MEIKLGGYFVASMIAFSSFCLHLSGEDLTSLRNALSPTSSKPLEPYGDVETIDNVRKTEGNVFPLTLN